MLLFKFSHSLIKKNVNLIKKMNKSLSSRKQKTTATKLNVTTYLQQYLKTMLIMARFFSFLDTPTQYTDKFPPF